MKTILVILLTLLVSQFLYVEYGPRNPVARISATAAESARWILHHVLDMMQ